VDSCGKELVEAMRVCIRQIKNLACKRKNFYFDKTKEVAHA